MTSNDEEALDAALDAILTDTMSTEEPIPANMSTDVEEAVPAVETAAGVDEEMKPPTPIDISPTKTNFTDDSGTFEENSFEEEEEALTSKNNKRRNLCFAAFTLLVVTGSLLGLLFGLGVVGGDDDQSDKGSIQGPETLSPVSPTSAPEPFGSPEPSTTAPAPTEPPVPAPTIPPPTEAPNSFLRDVVESATDASALDDPSSPQARAYQLLFETWDTPKEASTSEAVHQRFAMLTMYFSLTEAPTVAEQDMEVATDPECEWDMVECTDGKVTKFVFARRPNDVTGRIPPEVGLLSSLSHLDLSENEIKGSIPDEMYDLRNMTFLYLNHNDMTGSLSESISNWPLLNQIYLGNNRFSGPIPRNLRSLDKVRPLRFISFHHNQFTGNVPSNLQLSNLFYFDLSFNQLTGELPDDIDKESFRKLRHWYFDHNQLEGQIPESYTTVGNDRLIDFRFNDNKFTGTVPSSWTEGNKKLLTLNVQHNKLSGGLSDSICKMDVFEWGELVELGADCKICDCKNLCDNCYK